MAFLDRTRKQGCNSNQSSFQRISCINLESEARPALASRHRAWQECFAEEAWAAPACRLSGRWCVITDPQQGATSTARRVLVN